MGMTLKNLLKDPRHYQIAVLAMLLSYGIGVLDFGVQWHHAAFIVATALAVQFIGSRLCGLPGFDARSPLITALSLTLLFRTDSLLLAVAAAAIAIGSKFVIRVRGKHVFNPANLAIVTLMVMSDRAWISTGQWGNAAISTLALACLGFIVLTKAKRAETTIAFLFAFAALVVGRAIWLGDPISIPLHDLQNGALLVFAFFMISDPKTTPDSGLGRTLFAVVVATVAFLIQYVYYQPNGPVLALIIAAPLVPVIDTLLRGRTYHWHAAAAKPFLISNVKGAIR